MGAAGRGLWQRERVSDAVRTDFSKNSFMRAAFSALLRRRIMTALFTFNLEVA